MTAIGEWEKAIKRVLECARISLVIPMDGKTINPKPSQQGCSQPCLFCGDAGGLKRRQAREWALMQMNRLSPENNYGRAGRACSSGRRQQGDSPLRQGLFSPAGVEAESMPSRGIAEEPGRPWGSSGPGESRHRLDVGLGTTEANGHPQGLGWAHSTWEAG